MEPVVQLIQLALRVEREMEAQRRSSVAYRDEPASEESVRPSKREHRVKGNALCCPQPCECA